MPPTPPVPTPLVDVSLHRATATGVPTAVLFGPSEQDGVAVLGPGADVLGVDARWVHRHRLSTSAGTVRVVALETARPDHGWLLATGTGGERDWRTAGAALLRAVNTWAADEAAAGRPVPRTVQLPLPEAATAAQVSAFVLGAVVGSHHYRVTARDAPARTRALRLVGPPELEPVVARAQVLGRATALARDLAGSPSDVKDPAWLAATGARLAARVPGLRATVRDERWLAAGGFGGVLAVGGGSSRPPRLLELAWSPRGGASGEHLVLVGKGVTFDTGGISIKPADGMHLMRTDMSGGAAVIAAMIAVAQLGLALKVTGLVPCAENSVSGSAYRPGDIVRHVDGTTTEVTNTDAEGRLVLADALAYAVRRLRPTTLVDVATLTGSMKVSLGLRTGAVFATEPALAARVTAAGAAVGEAWWPMPLLADHAAAVRSEIADLRQAPPGPGGITAALYLREFTGGLPWAHLDIAGPARAEADYDEVGAGATGFSARTLVEVVAGLTG
ncbi:MAG: leucyl aminopeptidase family protein [Pseudonocardiaceae bacterium]